MVEDSIKIFKCLSDASRLKLINNLLEGPMYVELLAERLSLSSSTVSFHLKKLEEAGLVTSEKEQYYVSYTLNTTFLNQSVLQMIKKTSDVSDEMDEREIKYRNSVLKNFFEYGKLKTIPVQKKKRRIIYEEIIKAFEKEKKITEREVNLIIADFHDDFCTIRRDLIAEKLLFREEGIYWRG